MKVIELFSGAGGLALGLEQAGLETVALVEQDKWACATLRSNRPGWNVIESPVEEVQFTRGQADVVAGGFPCQAFSYAGKKLGLQDTRGTLFYEFARVVDEVQPKLFIAENVKGFLTHDGGKTLATAVELLSELGYIVEYKLLNAADYGVPQLRERLILVGTRGDKKFAWPAVQLPRPVLRDVLLDCPESAGQSYSARDKQVFDLVPEGGNWRNLPREVLANYVPYLLGKHGGGSTQTAKRLSLDDQSPTILTSPHQKTTARCHPTETRPLTVRESARIQGFPDDWSFQGGIAAQYKQIGNAVPVTLAKALGQAILDWSKDE